MNRMVRSIAVYALCVAAAHAQTRVSNGYLWCPATNYSVQQMADALSTQGMGARSSNIDVCMYGAVGRAESVGNTCLQNFDSRGGLGCCIGAFQVHRMHLSHHGFTAETFAQASLQEQARVYAAVAESNASSAGFSRLLQMRDSGQLFDGRRVTDGVLLACSQFGARVCNAAVNTGSCSGGADGYGSTICSFGASIDAKRDPNCSSSGTAICGPGDFPTPKTTATASAAPPPAASDILVRDGQV